MPAICETVQSKISENLSQTFKKTEKENFESHLAPTAKQVLSTKIEYEPVASYTDSILKSLHTKYTILKPNQPPFASSNGINNHRSHQNTTNGKLNSGGSSTSSQTQLPQPKKTLFPRESVQVGWNSIGRSWSSGCGFHNVGNTCYLNSALQAFFHVPALANWLANDNEHREKASCQSYQSCIICAMAQTLLNTQRQQHAITPSLITNRLHSICKHMSIGRQEDSHEFLRYLVEQMEKSFLLRHKSMPWYKDLDQYSKETTPLNQILGGYLRSTVTCLACKHESITFQHFMDLPLDISRVSTLNEALAGYFARENLEECGYKCESCKKKVSATKRFNLERAPVVLCIQLKRFNVMGGKLSKSIQIFQNLDLHKYLAKSGDLNQDCSYKLVSLVSHIGGSASGGHYTAIGLSPNGGYCLYDDSCVTGLSMDNVLRTNAYVLFYELVHHNKPRPYSNGNHLSEHTYSKSASSTSTSSSLPQREGFAKPKLPGMIPITILKQNNQQARQRENEKTPPRGLHAVTNGNGTNGFSKQLVPAVKLNNGKRAASDDEEENLGSSPKKMKPSLPRLTADETPVAPLTPPTPSSTTSTPTKPVSLVPYETDEEDEEPVSFCRTSSGVFLETDLKVVTTPSKQGSTVMTKASLANGVPRDPLQQLTKFNHSGYGTSEVSSWNNTPSSLSREVNRDQYEERKRQMEDDEDLEMDSGRVKKVRNHNGQQNGNQGKLPNPFQAQQNHMNRPQQQNFNDRDRSYNHNNNNSQSRHYSPNSNYNRNHNNGYHKSNNKSNYKQNGSNFNHPNRYQRNNGGKNYNNKHFNRNR